MMKKILFAILMILIISTTSGCGSNDTKNADQNKLNVSQSTNNSEEKIKVTKIVSNSNLIAKAMNIDNEKAVEIDGILSAIGLEKITSMYKMTDTAYQITAPPLSNQKVDVILVMYVKPNNSIDKIVFRNNKLYESGNILNTLTGTILSDNERNIAMREAERAVKSILKDPASAKFSGNYWVTKNNNIIRVVGTVHAKNSLNAVVLSKFFVDMDSKYKVIAVKAESL
ncbi:MAG: hypothetical protein ACLVJE_08145 [Phascolarctobacterium faecium]|uniref:hypothetical protein n=1 Tax=Phascolarctobacterium faecium TaxID=33025 RepID=UPI00399B3A3B